MAASWIKRVGDKPLGWEDIYSDITTTTSSDWVKDAYTKVREHQGLNEVEVLRANLKELQKENKELKEFIEKWAIGETDE